MGKIRVYQVAKELGIDSRELVSQILAMGIDVRNYMSSLDPDDVLRVKRAFDKQRHEEMVEEEIKPGVTRRRSLRPRAPARKTQQKVQPSESSSPPAPVPPVRRKPSQRQQARKGPAVPPPPESAVLPSSRPRAMVSEPAPREPEKKEAEVAPKEEPAKASQPVAPEPVAPPTPPKPAARRTKKTAEETPVEAKKKPDKEESKPPAKPSKPAKTKKAKEKPEKKKSKKAASAEPPKPPQPPAKPEPPKAKRKSEPRPSEKAEVPARPEPPKPPARPEPPKSQMHTEPPVAPEPPSPPAPPEPPVSGRTARPVAPEPPVPQRPEPPVSRQNQKPAVIIDLPPRPQTQKSSSDPFPVGPANQQNHGKTHKKLGRRKEVKGHDLQTSQRNRRSGPNRRPPKKQKPRSNRKAKHTEITVPKESKRVIRIESTVSLQELAKRMGVKATEVLVKLMEMGVGSIHINSMLDTDTAKIIAEEFHYQVEDVSVSEEALLEEAQKVTSSIEQEEDNLEIRPPVVTMLGHVDHGKTSLLDKIRETRVAQGEAGGITQHIGAYQVRTEGGAITFIDTPGHEAFTAMRARGANSTDISVLVVAADDGVMPTTKEAINHARAAKTPIIVALNKMDLLEANPDLVLRGLAEQNLQPVEWQGDTEVCKVSARTGEGIDSLLETILLQSEVMELKANPKAPGQGVVLEAQLEKGRGPVATALVQNGTLRVGEYIVAGCEHGRIRVMGDENGNKLEEAPPSTPVEILGLSGTPQAGDPVNVVADAKKGEQLADMRANKKREGVIPAIKTLPPGWAEGETVESVNLIIKGDVQGSVEAIRAKVSGLSTEEVEVNVIDAGVGGITKNDVLLASASDPKAYIFGFGVRTAGQAQSVAEQERVEIRFHTIIYELIDDVKNLMIGRLQPTYKEVDLGRAEVRKTFRIPKIGTIAGCYVLDGKVIRSALVRLVRDSREVWKGKVGSLRRVKDDVKEVTSGYECGIGLEGFNDLKDGDIIEAFELEEIAPTL